MSERRKVYTNHVIGNNALDLSRGYAQPLRQPEQIPENPVIVRGGESVYRDESKIDTNYVEINQLCTIVLAFVIIATLGVCVVFLKSQFAYSELNSEIESIKRELNSIKRENIQLEEDLDNMVDLETIYVVATTRLDMRLPGPNDVYYINSGPVTYTTKYAPVKVNKEENSIGSVLGNITRGW